MVQHILLRGLALFLIVLVLSCNKKSSLAKTDQPMEAEEPIIEEVAKVDTLIIEEPVKEIITEDEDAEEAIYILCELKRTSCFGKCPSYSIKLYSDGRATFHGKSNVDKLGHFSSFVSPQDFNLIFEAAESANYFVLKSQYPKDGQTIPDLPKTITYLKRNGLEKRIINNYEAPTALLDFEKWLEAFFNSLEWKKVDS